MKLLLAGIDSNEWNGHWSYLDMLFWFIYYLIFKNLREKTPMSRSKWLCEQL